MAGEVSARELTQRVWAEAAAERATRPAPDAGLGDYDRLVEDDERLYINSRYVLDRAPSQGGEEVGRPLSRPMGRLRRRAAQFVVQVLERYLDDEREFLSHLVRLQNMITVHIDRLSGEVRQLEAVLRAESDRLRAADTALHASLEDRLDALENEIAALRRPGGRPGP
jgi:hypothetical protein